MIIATREFMVKDDLQELIESIEDHPSIESEEAVGKANFILRQSIKSEHLRGQMVAIWVLSLAKCAKGHLDEAEGDLNQVLALAEQIGSPKFKGRARSALGGIYYRKDLLPKSLEYLHTALKTIDPFWEGAIFNNLGLIYKHQQEMQMAEHCFQKAMQIADTHKNTALHISVMLNFVNLKLDQGEQELAVKLLGEIIQLSSKSDYTRGKLYALIHLFKIYQDRGNLVKAEQIGAELLETSNNKGFKLEYIRCLQLLGMLYVKKEQPEGLPMLERALTMARELEHRGFMLEVLRDLHQIYDQREELDKAYQYSKELNQFYKIEIQERDKSQLKKLLAEKDEEIFSLEQQRRQISKQNEELRQYAYIVAHDLKEPLRNISGFVSLISKKYENILDLQGREYLTFVKQGANHMNQQLNDLLTYATLSLDPQRMMMCDLTQILSNVVESFKPQIDAAGIRVEIEPLPPQKGNPEHFYQLLYNLVQNAIKFRRPGADSYIKLYSEVHNQMQIYFIKDNGIGINEEYFDIIFKIFKRLDRKNYPGTGIGLPICQKIVQLYQGDIGVRSDLGQGTCFYFFFGETDKENDPLAQPFIQLATKQ